MAIPVILLLRGQQPFRSAAQACTLGNGCTRISVLSPQHLRFARACFGISGFTMICGALKSASVAQGLLPPANLSLVTERLQMKFQAFPFTTGRSCDSIEVMTVRYYA